MRRLKAASICIYILVLIVILIACDEKKASLSITSTSPSSGASGISITSSIQITFSLEMNTASAENAFSLSPSVAGSFSWSGNTLVFSPGSNLSCNTTYTVVVSSSAEAADGTSLGSDYSFSFTTEEGGTSGKFPVTRDGIYVFSDQISTGLSEAQYQFAAEHYVGCQKMTLGYVQKLKSYNPDFIVLHYRLAHGAGNHQIITGNDWVYYWDDVNPHENWFIHSTRGNQGSARVHNSEWGWDYTDPSGQIEGAGSDGWKEYFVQATIEEMRATECDGVFADSCGLPFSLSSWPSWLQNTNPLTSWCPHVNTFMQYVMTQYKAQAEQFVFIPNAGNNVTSWDTVTDYSIADGVMIEGFSEWGGGSLYGEYSDWVLQMNRILALTAQDKIIIMQTYPSVADTKKRMFALGCYLLVKGNYSYINMPPDGEIGVFWFPEYDIDLGEPQANAPGSIESLAATGGLFRRDYANGFVLVNPIGGAVTYSLGGTYRRITPSGGGEVNSSGSATGSLNYSSVTSVTLQSGEAAVLLNN